MAKTIDNIDFILASASPRRRLLLDRAGYKFTVCPSGIDESAFDSLALTPAEHTRQLALAKTIKVSKLHPSRIVLGADTVVDFQGRIIGKAADPADAERITRLLFSAPHSVITSIALLRDTPALNIVLTDTTIVYPHPLTEQQILEHIQTGRWQGKAGAYGIQETADRFVDRIEGSFTNVMGLPMEITHNALKKLAITPHK